MKSILGLLVVSALASFGAHAESLTDIQALILSQHAKHQWTRKYCLVTEKYCAVDYGSKQGKKLARIAADDVGQQISTARKKYSRKNIKILEGYNRIKQHRRKGKVWRTDYFKIYVYKVLGSEGTCVIKLISGKDDIKKTVIKKQCGTRSIVQKLVPELKADPVRR